MNLGESIATQIETVYEDYNKLKTLVDLGYFLENYVVSGGVVTKDVTQNNYINVTEIVVSLDNDVTRREAATFKTTLASSTYYLDYKSSGDFNWDTAHYSGSYLPVAQVTTDANKNVLVITDMRGTVGGFRLLSNYGLTGYLQMVNVADFGADGVGDDTTAIQAAIDSAVSKGIRYIQFGYGKTYTVTTLTTYDNMTFVGNFSAMTSNGLGIRSRILNMTLNGIYVEDSQRGKPYQNVIEKMINGLAVKIVCYGDSITFGWEVGTGLQLPNNYPATLQTLLRAYYKNNNITVVNRGTGGLQSDELISSTYFNPVITDNPDLIIFMCGINDAFSSGFGPVVPVTDFSKNLLMINKMGGNKPVIFMTTSPVWDYFDTTAYENQVDRIYEYVEAVQELQRNYGMKVIDLYSIIRKDITMRNVRAFDISPDFIHYTDAYYKKIGEFVFAFGLVNTDIMASNDKYFPAVDSIFNFKDLTPRYNNSGFNPQGYNIPLDASGQTNKCYAYIFVDTASADLLLNNVVWTEASTANTVTVDGVVYTVPGHTSVDMILWDVQTFITNLNYGLHKIEFQAVTDGTNRTFFTINGITLKNVPVVLNDRDSSPKNTGTVSINKDFNVLYNGKTELSILKTSGGNVYKHIMSLGYKKQKHYRIYAQVGLGSGIGFGRYTSKAPDGTVYDAPCAILVFEIGGPTRIYVRRFSSPATWFDDVQTLIPAAGGVSIAGDTFVILDVVVNTSDITLYSSGTLIITIPTGNMAFGELNLYLFNYCDGVRATDPTTKIYKIVELPYASPATEYFEGETYYDSVANVEKIYNGTAWKTVTVT